MVKSLLQRLVEYLEKRNPLVAGKLCGNPTCPFYINMLISAEKTETCTMPPHSCIGHLGLSRATISLHQMIQKANRKAALSYMKELGITEKDLV